MAIKKVATEQTGEEKVSALEQAIDITRIKIEKALAKKASLEMDIDSLVLSLELLENEINK